MPSVLTPHVWKLLALTEAKVPEGGVAWPSSGAAMAEKPEQVTLPSIITSQVYQHPALTEAEVLIIEEPLSESPIVDDPPSAGASLFIDAESALAVSLADEPPSVGKNLPDDEEQAKTAGTSQVSGLIGTLPQLNTGSDLGGSRRMEPRKGTPSKRGSQAPNQRASTSRLIDTCRML